MTDAHARAFLASLAAGADLDAALGVGATAPGPAGERFAGARAEIASGMAPAESLRRLPVSSAIAVLCGLAPANRLFSVAERLLQSLAPRNDQAAAVHRAMQLQVGLLLAATNALVALLILAGIRHFLRPLQANALTEGLQVTAAVALVSAALLAAYELIRRPPWPAQAVAERGRIAHRLVMYLAAGADGGVPAARVLSAVDARGHRNLVRRWQAAVETTDRYGPAADALRDAGLLSTQVARIAQQPLDGESDGAAWARAAALVDDPTTVHRPGWPIYASMGLSALGVGLGVISAWHLLIHLAEAAI